MIKLLTEYPTIFANNKYLKWYEQLIIRAINRVQDANVYYEKHHYIPKSIIPNNNLVALTSREHYIAHLLLAKCVTPQYQKKMVYAITAMKFKVVDRIKINSKLYSILQLKANQLRAVQMRNRIVTAETRQKLRTANLGKKVSDATKQKQSNAAKGRIRSPEAIEAGRLKHIGMKRSEETKAKLRAERATRSPLICPHCNKSVLPGNYHRWHGNNCKHANGET